MSDWIEIDTPEDISPKGVEVLVWDGCDYAIDFVEVCVDTGTFYMANGTVPTHYKALTPP